jgi:hypothetical protein
VGPFEHKVKIDRKIGPLATEKAPYSGHEWAFLRVPTGREPPFPPMRRSRSLKTGFVNHHRAFFAGPERKAFQFIICVPDGLFYQREMMQAADWRAVFHPPEVALCRLIHL